jgi:hypothetical protein
MSAADRQDIHALLTGALYGELDGDERARLDAHLVNHPQDRSALEGLRSTRAMLRDADVAAYLGSAEPAPAISAKLIQEAARRAPAHAAGGGAWAWLSSLFRPFLTSPALAAATALVLVGGAAGVMYARGTFESTEPRARGEHLAMSEKVDQAPAPAAAGAAPTAGAPIDDYRVDLAEGQAQGTAAIMPGAADETIDGKDQVALEGNQQRKSELAFQPSSSGPARASKKGGTKRPPGYIALDPVKKDAPAVLTADGDDFRSENERAKNVATDKITSSSRGAGGGGTTFESALAEGRTPDVAPAPAPPATAPKPAAIARDAGKSGTANPAQAAALETWARDQHARMVGLVKKGQCTDAGYIGADIMRRAPDYYAANVANDRQLRSCKSYVDRARRAKSEDVKSKAAAPRSPAPESQVDMEDAAH